MTNSSHCRARVLSAKQDRGSEWERAMKWYERGQRDRGTRRQTDKTGKQAMKFLQWQHVTLPPSTLRELEPQRESARQRESERVAMQCRDIDIDRDNKEREGERERDPTAPAPSARRKSPAISTCLQPQLWHNFGILMRNPYLCCLFCQKTKKNKQNRERKREWVNVMESGSEKTFCWAKKVRTGSICGEKWNYFAPEGRCAVGGAQILVALLWPVESCNGIL